ncbi:MAG: serine/threonine protein kinase [Myxococcales bacterium]|nr:serine/threonine protein kinase [Myxococcales bacterium]
MAQIESHPRNGPSTARFGRYTLVERLAAGGMADIYRALEPRPVGEPRSVVVKRILPHLEGEAWARRLFEDEARLASHVDHPNVVQVLDFGQEDGTPYLVLEYVLGCDLWHATHRLDTRGERLTVDLAVHIVRELLAGLVAVHEAVDMRGERLDMVHGDVSPSNVLLSLRGDVKLGDFGVARSLRDDRGRKTGVERTKGKLGYLAPEQVHGDLPDQRTDLFAVGTIAAELLSGAPLFAADSDLATLLAIRDTEIQPFLDAAASLPRGLTEVVRGALAQDPADRPASAAAFRDALAPYQVRDSKELREEVSDLVRDARAAMSSSSRRVPSVGRSERASSVEIVAEAPPVTADVEPITYRVDSGGLTAILTYAQVVEAIALGRLAPNARVSVGGAPYQPITTIPTLARHLPRQPKTRPPEAGETAPPAPEQPDAIDLADGGLGVALARSALDGATGVWRCESGAVRKDVFVDHGAVQSVSSNQQDDLLGEHLVQSGVVHRDELDMALATLHRYGGRLGDALVGLGVIEPLALFHHVATQVRLKLIEVFCWPDGRATFAPDVAPPEQAFRLRLPLWETLHAGLHARYQAGLERHRFDGRRSDLLTLASAAPRALALDTLSDDLRLALRVLRRPLPLSSVVGALAPRYKDDTELPYRTVTLLLMMDAVRWADDASGRPSRP